MSEGMKPEPDLDDPAQVYVHRGMQALMREFADDEQVPRLVVVFETPPEGEIVVASMKPRIAVASTGDDEVDTHRMLSMAAASIRAGMTTETQRKARQLWQSMRAGFERRN